jgi:hypothetical protein
MSQAKITFMKKNPDYYEKYYEKNKEKLLEKGRKKIKCECNKIYTFSNKSKHEKTNYHIMSLKIKELEKKK